MDIYHTTAVSMCFVVYIFIYILITNYNIESLCNRRLLWNDPVIILLSRVATVKGVIYYVLGKEAIWLAVRMICLPGVAMHSSVQYCWMMHGTLFNMTVHGVLYWTTAAVNAAKWLTNLTCSQSVVQFRHLHLHFFFRGQTVLCKSVANKKSCGCWCASRFHLCSWHVKQSSKVPVIQMV